MSTTTKTKRKRIKTSELVASSNESVFNTIKALKRINQCIKRVYTPGNYLNACYKIVTVC